MVTVVVNDRPGVPEGTVSRNGSGAVPIAFDGRLFADLNVKVAEKQCCACVGSETVAEGDGTFDWGAAGETFKIETQCAGWRSVFSFGNGTPG